MIPLRSAVMAENESAPAGEQPPVTSTNIPAGDQPQSGDLSAAIQNMDVADLAGLLDLEEAASSQPEPSAPAPQVEAAPQGEQPADVVEEETPAAPAPGEPKGAPSRIRTGFLPPDQQTLLNDALAAVKTGKAADLPSAIALLLGTSAAAPVPATDGDIAPVEAAPATPAPAAPAPEVIALEAELANLRTDRRAARTAFDTDAEIDLTEKIEDVTAKLALARSTAITAAHQAQAQQATYHEKFDAAASVVETRYPDALDGDSVFSRFLSDRIDAAKLRKDPALADPNFLITYADQVAKDLGLTTTAPIPPAPKRPARLIGQDLAPGHQTATRFTPDQLRAALSDLDVEAHGDAIFTE